MGIPDAEPLPELSGTYVAMTEVGPDDPALLYPEERRLYDKLPNARRQAEWLAGRRAARGALRAVGAGAARVLRDAKGAPRLTGPHAESAEIAITHGKHHAAAIATRVDGLHPHVGIDWVDAGDKKRIDRIAHRVLTPREFELSNAQPELLLACWGAREAAAKATRTGMFAFALSGVHVTDYHEATGELRLNHDGLRAFLRRVASDVVVVAAADVPAFARAQKEAKDRAERGAS